MCKISVMEQMNKKPIIKYCNDCNLINVFALLMYKIKYVGVYTGSG